MSQGGPSLTAKGIVHAYPAVGTILRGVSLEVHPGEIVALIGPSGCGKSTLLRLLCGLERPDEGSVLLGGERVDSPSRRIGLVFQQQTLFPWLSVLDNVMFGMEEKRPERAVQLLAAVGLDGFKSSLPKHLSGGMAQRVCLARAIGAAPTILLLDEPFSALDTDTREIAHELLVREIRGAGIGVLLVTHDYDEASALADRVLAFSHRPAAISWEFRLDLPQPRVTNGLVVPGFQDLRNQIAAGARHAVASRSVS